MVHIMKLKKNELPEGWRVRVSGKNYVDYRTPKGFVIVHKEGDRYWFDWGVKDKEMLESSFTDNKNKVKPMLKKIMKEDIVLRRN